VRLAGLVLLVTVGACSPTGTVRRPFGLDTSGEDTAGDDTAAVPLPEFSFAVFGDNQFSTTSCTSGTPERMAIPEAIRDLDPTFVLHTGDLMDHGYEDGAYDHFVSCYADLFAETPFFPTAGNHDMGNGAIWAYKSYLEKQFFIDNPAAWAGDYAADFTVAYEDDPNEYSTDFDDKSHLDSVPSGVSWETFYAMRHENAVLISFEQGTRWWSNTPKTWLEGHLAAAKADPDVDHVFVTMHHPMYSTKMAEESDSECVGPVRGYYESLFRDHDVTLVFAGHTHIYDRFHVPDDGSHTRQTPPPTSYDHDAEEVHYLVAGGGGGPLREGCDPMPDPREEHSYGYSQTRGCGYHFVHVEVVGPALTVRVIGVEGSRDDYTTTVWDEFRIE
jgi:hypothetical protein